MPIIKSAKKRVKVAAKASARNAKTKRQMREAIKAFAKALAGGKPAEIAKAQAGAISAIDMAAKKNVIHVNKAARRKSQLAAKVKAAGVKPTKSVAKKAPAKKADALHKRSSTSPRSKTPKPSPKS